MNILLLGCGRNLQMNNCSFWNIPGSITVKQWCRQLDNKCNKRLKFQDDTQIHSVIFLFIPKPMALLLLRVLSAFPLHVLIFRDLLVTEVHSRQTANTRKLKSGQRQRALFTADRFTAGPTLCFNNVKNKWRINHVFL